VITLWANLIGNHDEDEDVAFWSLMNIILLQATNLKSLESFERPIRLGLLGTITHTSHRALTTLHIRIDPTSIDALAFVQQLFQLRELRIVIGDGEAIDLQGIPRLSLPGVTNLGISTDYRKTFTQNGGAQAILSYMAESTYGNDCECVFWLPMNNYLQLNPFFNTHTCTKLSISFTDGYETTVEFPAASTIFNKSRTVIFEGFVPVSTIFNTA
jgi:hypothetical protein